MPFLFHIFFIFVLTVFVFSVCLFDILSASDSLAFVLILLKMTEGGFVLFYSLFLNKRNLFMVVWPLNIYFKL